MPRRLFPLPIALIGASLLLGACGSSSSATLPGTAWTVTDIAGRATVATAPPTIIFGTDGTVSGTTGCNQYNGTYTTDGDKLTVGPLATTRMACDDAINVQEAAFTEAFSGATSWSIKSDGSLEIKGTSDILGSPAGQPET